MPTHKQVAENWAKQTGRKCNGFHMFYTGPTIWSYGDHFPIATIKPNRVMFTSERYSVSTAKHKSIVRRAIRENMFGTLVFECPHVHDDTVARKVENWQYMRDQASEALGCFKRARLPKTQSAWVTDMWGWVASANSYRRAAGIEDRVGRMTSTADLEDLAKAN